MTGTVPRRVPARRRALLLLVTSFIGFVGLMVLVLGWFGLAVSTSRAAAEEATPCLEAYGTDPGVEVRYETLPSRAVCVRWVGAEQEFVVIAAVPVGVTVGALTCALGGAVGALVVLRTMRPTTVV